MGIIISVIGGTLALIGVLYYFMRKRMQNQVWEGTLIDKKEEVTEGEDYSYNFYVLLVQLADGSKKRVTVPHKIFEQFSVGDRLIKARGETHPRKQ